MASMKLYPEDREAIAQSLFEAWRKSGSASWNELSVEEKIRWEKVAEIAWDEIAD